MENILKKLVSLIFYLALIGTCLAIIFMPRDSEFVFLSSLFSFISEMSFIYALAIFYLVICTTQILSTIIEKITTYRKLGNINSDLNFARSKNIIYIFFWNFVFGLILCLTIIFMINTFYPFDNSKNPGDIDWALITTFIIVPGFLLSLRLLSNPVKNKPIIPLPILLVVPETDLFKIKKLKERTVSFYFAFIETTFFSVLILFTYLGLKSGNGVNSLYSTVFAKLMPNFPIITILFFVMVFSIILLLTTICGEVLLEIHEPHIQE